MMSVVLIVVRSLPDWCPPPEPGGHKCFVEAEQFTNIFFSVEYVMKLMCSPYCRHAIYNREFHLEVAVPELNCKEEKPLQHSQVERLTQFLTRPLNCVDFLAVLPFWLALTV